MATDGFLHRHSQIYVANLRMKSLERCSLVHCDFRHLEQPSYYSPKGSSSKQVTLIAGMDFHMLVAFFAIPLQAFLSSASLICFKTRQN
ncbi:hypothetical protein pdam_00011247 [Pocillopora damicornis]|uniref:Uncharacterized protein n=1 Tax=Pocillopora damicornis TaxID=46731 RepID=A0A3M6U6Y2_POCDA|nr:hypothetical protein pdam_00011247 [Pocillopora damicornis]